MKTRILILVALALLVGTIQGPAPAQAAGIWDTWDYYLRPGFVVRDYCVVDLAHRHRNFYRDFPTRTAAGLVNTVIEIPAGTNQKFEVNEDTGKMCWEIKNGKPRVVKFLGYPANYGNVPRTMGGDGDSLDMVTLGRFEWRGTVAQVRLIGVMHMSDGGDPDDKLIGVLPGSDFDTVNTLADLDAQFPGTTGILEAWFESYKGPGEIEVTSFGEVEDANAVLAAGMAAFQ